MNLGKTRKQVIKPKTKAGDDAQPRLKPSRFINEKDSLEWMGKLTRIKIVKVLAPNKYIVSPLKFLNSERIKDVEDKLKYEWAQMGSLVGEHGKNPEVGADVFVITKNPGNCSRANYRRGYVLKKWKFLTDLVYDVFFYDYCVEERVPVQRLKILPNAYKEIPPRFLFLTLPGICPRPDNVFCDESQASIRKLRREIKSDSFKDLNNKIKDIIKDHESNGAYFEFSNKFKDSDKMNLFGDIFFVNNDQVSPQSLIQLLYENENLEFSNEWWREQLKDEELDIILAKDIEPLEATRKKYYGYFPFEATRTYYI